MVYEIVEVVVVHAIDKDAVTFYAQRGFTQFEDHELHLFMPVKNLLATLEPILVDLYVSETYIRACAWEEGAHDV